MPCYIMNEFVFSDLSDEAIAEIEALTVNAQGIVDFNILSPLPDQPRLEWRDDDMKEAISIWGTKRNAHANPPFKMVKKPGDGRIVLRFLTVTNPPWCWMMTLLTKLQTSVQYTLQYTWCWGGQFGLQCTFDYRSKDPISERRIEGNKDLRKRMRKLYKKATAIRPEPSLEQSEEVNSPDHKVSTSSDEQSKKIDELAWEITRAVTDCPHQIDAENVVLKFTPNSEGHNALNQLLRRVKAILATNPAFSD